MRCSDKFICKSFEDGELETAIAFRDGAVTMRKVIKSIRNERANAVLELELRDVSTSTTKGPPESQSSTHLDLPNPRAILKQLQRTQQTVSYTHLTLPTKRIV